jgi:hypothetical protein
MMQKNRKRVNSRLGGVVVVFAALLFMAAVTAGQAAPDPQVKGQAEQKATAGQQLCPATPGAKQCQVVIDCPPIKSQGQTVCQATIDCPDTKAPVKDSKKKSKNPD